MSSVKKFQSIKTKNKKKTRKLPGSLHIQVLNSKIIDFYFARTLLESFFFLFLRFSEKLSKKKK